MRITRLDDLHLVRDALTAYHRTVHNRIMRTMAEVGDARVYIRCADLLRRANEELEELRKRAGDPGSNV